MGGSAPAEAERKVSVGFSGHFVFGHGDRPLLEAPAFDGIRPPWGDGAHELRPRPGGWQTLQFRDERWGSEQLRALVEWSGAPACFAMVYDSDVAYLTGLDLDGREWEAVLGLAVAAEMNVSRPQNVHDDLEWIESPECAEAAATSRAALEEAVPGSARAAIAWATAAGVATAVGQRGIEAVLRSHEVFVEDSFIALIDALGFPPAVPRADDAEA
jgi:hypothetical protein